MLGSDDDQNDNSDHTVRGFGRSSQKKVEICEPRLRSDDEDAGGQSRRVISTGYHHQSYQSDEALQCDDSAIGGFQGGTGYRRSKGKARALSKDRALGESEEHDYWADEVRAMRCDSQARSGEGQQEVSCFGHQ